MAENRGIAWDMNPIFLHLLQTNFACARHPYLGRRRSAVESVCYCYKRKRNGKSRGEAKPREKTEPVAVSDFFYFVFLPL